MSFIIGPALVVIGIGMVFFALPKKRKYSWVTRFAFIGELYAVAAVSFVVLGLRILLLE